MASTLLATIAITLSSLISVFVSSSADNATSEIVYGNKSALLSSIKYFTILLCFLVAFLCNVQSIRYYAHVSFLATIPSSMDNMESVEYVARNLNRGSYFWSLGLRAFYLSFPLLLWIFGPIPMFLCCCCMSFLLYFLDTTSTFTRNLHRHSFKEDMLKGVDVESLVQTSNVSLNSQELCSSFPGRKFPLENPTFVPLYCMLASILQESQITTNQDAFS
ncbi:hypothetical protein COLO4_04947 [Corchorus olitorius]|uniref:Uncharacterized protein n=1 Tax=Corchorus olitorius TaxID=93759 RepID=A0A1R3KSG9_9ROSI|nr:hypothetical protein COLO4_04947 [Corchorus olitorius]